ncbi:DUF3108 domain-containing protein [Methylibium sp.]|uniref:DUF3108 domain-containing protein n=1 Tax=Methylibium sp. TaxID=2067992 RepID=UPI003D0DF10A
MSSIPQRPHRSVRRGVFVLLVGLTLLLHLWLADRVGALLGEDSQAVDSPPRLQAAFVRELLQAAPPVVAPTPAAPPRRRAPAPAAAPVATPASAPHAAPVEPIAEVASAPASAPESAPALADGAAAAAGEAVASAPGSPPLGEPAFAWPASTRLSYTLTGYVRGEVLGTAQVEWLRDGDRYQVHLDVVVGPGFAPLMQRRMTSDGEITPQGLVPRRYDEQTQVAFGRTRTASLHFDADGVTLANGQRHAGLPALQDTASQFVQLTYLFTTGAERLHPGGRIEMPLALPRRVDRWVYDVIGEEALATPFGPVPAWHLRPQREGDASSLSIEAWFAPSLQYLPVRIVIRRGAEEFIDLMIERLPLQATEEALGGSALR